MDRLKPQNLLEMPGGGTLALAPSTADGAPLNVEVTGELGTSAFFFNDNGLGEVEQAVIGEAVWSTENTLTWYLEFSDYNGNGENDWNEDGAEQAMERAFAQWERLGNLDMERVSVQSEANLVQRIGNADGNLSYHITPDTGDFQSEGEYNQTADSWTASGLAQGGRGYLAILNALGIGLGLDQTIENDLLPGVADQGVDQNTGNTLGLFDDLGSNYLNQGIFTNMSFNDGWALRGGSASETSGWQGGPMAIDIAAYQALYGANFTTASGNDVYTLADQNGPGTFYETIWDGGGTDRIVYRGDRDASIFLDDATIDNTPTGGGIVSHVAGIDGGFTIARNVVIEEAYAGEGDDFVAGNQASNVIRGYGGDDVLVGQLGNDTLNAGEGHDMVFGDHIDFNVLFAADATVGGGISLGSGLVTAGQGTVNNTISTAINVSSEFSLSANGDVFNGTGIPHVTVRGTGNDQIDVYAVTINNPYATIVADIDNTSANFDSVLKFTGAGGAELRRGDDSRYDLGGAGSSLVYGTDVTTDSYLEFQPGKAGTWYIGVFAFGIDGDTSIAAGETYDLNIQVLNEYQASRYGHFAQYFDENETGGGDDFIRGRAGDDTIYTGDGNDYADGGVDEDLLYGGDGNDELRGNLDPDILYGEAGDDTMFGGNAVDQVFGADGNDYLDAGNGDDSVYGGDGNDTLRGINGIDLMYGEDGNDTLLGGIGFDDLFGGAGDDFIDGGNGNDQLFGGSGNDELRGNLRADVLDGGAGNDDLLGGEGLDTYVFSGADFGADEIIGWEEGEAMDLGAYAGLGFGDLAILQDGGATVITLAEGSIRLRGVDSTSIDAGDFLFA